MAIRFYIVREMIFIFIYLIFPPITYLLQCYLASRENDKQRFIIKYGRLPEAFVALIIGVKKTELQIWSLRISSFSTNCSL